MPSLLQKLIADQRRYAVERIAELRKFATHFHHAQRFLKRFVKRGARMAYFHGDIIVLEVTVENFKSDAMKVIEWIESRGYNAVKSEDVPEWNERRFYFVADYPQHAETVDSSHVIRLDCTLRENTAKCKRVQVGVKVEPAREVPVYEFRCA